MPRTAAVLRHVAFEDLGAIAPVLARHGFSVTMYEAGVDDFAAIDPVSADLLIMLGGPIGAYEEDRYPFVADEIALLSVRLAARRPTLGICLGAQAMARALGARVYPGPVKEIGWAPLTLTDAGRAGPLRHLDGASVLHWHGDTFDLPDGAERLASTSLTPNQAFAVGNFALGLQFHIEAEMPGFERWLIGHACEIGAVPGLSVNALRDDARRFAAATAAAGVACFAEWLDHTGA